MKPLIIYGVGQMAKMVAQYADNVVAFTVDRCCHTEAKMDGKPIVVWEVAHKFYDPPDHDILVVVGYREMNQLRADRHAQAMEMGYGSINLIHPSVHIHKSVKLGTGNIILEHTSIHPFTEIGDCNFISSNVNVGHGCEIGNNCWINAGVSIAGNVTLMSNCFVGQNAFITDNLMIKHETFISAGCRISHDTEFGDVYVSPAGEKFPMSSRKFIEWSER